MNTDFGLSLLCLLFGVVFMLGIIYVALKINGCKPFFTQICFSDKADVSTSANQAKMDEIEQRGAVFYEKRNEYWSFFGQIVITVLIALILLVLLITKKISPESGLPVLSALGGFSIANVKSITPPKNKERQGSNG